MDKVKRLKNYLDKDYTERIDFPVELVGRDGVVRRYTYGDSVRIYERRIESAHVRYADPVVASREIDHCTRRIQQLRRSWQELMQTSERRYLEQHVGVERAEPYEQGKQFLTRYLEERQLGQVLVDLGPPRLAILEESPLVLTFYVDWPVLHQGTLLYVYRLDEASQEASRVLYTEFLRRLSTLEYAPDTEKLVHSEETDAFAFVLTCVRAEAVVRPREVVRVISVPVRPTEPEQAPPTPPAEADGPWFERFIRNHPLDEDSPFQRGIEALHHNALDRAYDGFREALDENPHHRDAYAVLGALSDILHRWNDGESYLLMGSRYFPDDARIRYFLGLAAFRRQELKQAIVQLEQAIKLNPRMVRAYGLLACALALTHRRAKTVFVLERGQLVAPRDQGFLRLAVPLLRTMKWEMQSLMVGLLALLLAVAVAVVFSPLWSGLLGGVATGIVAATLIRTRRNLRALIFEWTRPSFALLPD